MSWTGSICDTPIAYRAAGSGRIAKNILGLVDGDLATVATARAACLTANATKQICDQVIGQNCGLGFTIADNMDATFGSDFTAFFASLPTNPNQMQMIPS